MVKGNRTKDLKKLLDEGFTRKFATFYLAGCKYEEKIQFYDAEYREWAHSHGFWCEHACLYGLDDSNVGTYLSDYDFYKVWPLNAWQRIWINDKLTLKLMLADHELSSLMPKYYYYSSELGLRPSCDNPNINDVSIEGFIRLLKEIGEFACKPCNGTASGGFYKLSFANDFFINNKTVSLLDVERFVIEHPNYVFTEYLHPAEEYGRISPLIHTMRVNALNVSGGGPRLLRSYIRFADSGCVAANYFTFDGTDVNAHHVQVGVNLDNGQWGDGVLIYPNRKEHIKVHPDSGVALEGQIEGFGELKRLLLKVAQKFNCIEFMGFDVCMSSQGFKIMEINSHPGISYLQVYKSLLADAEFKNYISGKLSAIDSMTPEQRNQRNAIVR